MWTPPAPPCLPQASCSHLAAGARVLNSRTAFPTESWLPIRAMGSVQNSQAPTQTTQPKPDAAVLAAGRSPRAQDLGLGADSLLGIWGAQRGRRRRWWRSRALPALRSSFRTLWTWLPLAWLPPQVCSTLSLQPLSGYHAGLGVEPPVPGPAFPPRPPCSLAPALAGRASHSTPLAGFLKDAQVTRGGLRTPGMDSPQTTALVGRRTHRNPSSAGEKVAFRQPRRVALERTDCAHTSILGFRAPEL